jgi:predicted kinase
VADVAFLTMDFARHGRRDLGRAFIDAYLRLSHDDEGRQLLPFYTAYRAVVRGKVQGMKATEPEVAEADRARALVEARAHWLLALGELDDPGRRPCVVLVGGLPGTGKSTLARALATHARFTIVRSDLVRKQLAGLPGETSSQAGFGEGIYSPAWTERTYAECAHQTESLLFGGERVIVDATFAREQDRLRFLDLAQRWSVTVLQLYCRAYPDIARSRLEQRRHDASDADWSIYRESAARWEQPGPATRASSRDIDTGGKLDRALRQATEALKELGLQD